MAKQTIDDHKYLLEDVENRAAIAYFAMINRNYCLFTALKSFIDHELALEQAYAKDHHCAQTKDREVTDMDDVSNAKADKKISHSLKMLQNLRS